MTAYTRK